MSTAGRSCPLHYRYGAGAIAKAPEEAVETLYVVGGLYGNPFALHALKALLDGEPGAARVCFNGDFNWFNTHTDDFALINTVVLAHDATLGNVEAELMAEEDTMGCGCAYPDSVTTEVVERSNRIHARLKATARAHPDLLTRLQCLPMIRRYRVGATAVGVVHGDADNLAGWGFDAARVIDPTATSALKDDFARAQVQIFASSHTCLPVCRSFGPDHALINNGAAGMPNFRDTHHGVITRISVTPAPMKTLCGLEVQDTHVDALALHYDAAAWRAHFEGTWPPGSDAHTSYFDRIASGPAYEIDTAYPRAVSDHRSS